MIPRVLLDRAPVPLNSEELRLYQRGSEYSIWIGQTQLMTSQTHGSEERLGELACESLATRRKPQLLIGGLGMGFTLAAALRRLPPGAQVTVAELIPAVVAWNHGPLAHLAGHPLADPRVTVCEMDVAVLLRTPDRPFDAIIMDVDNGPEGLTREENDWLYDFSGLGIAYAALKPGGLLTVWSSHPDQAFTRRLRQVGFAVEELTVRATGRGKGARHLIWVAKRASQNVVTAKRRNSF